MTAMDGFGQGAVGHSSDNAALSVAMCGANVLPARMHTNQVGRERVGKSGGCCCCCSFFFFFVCQLSARRVPKTSRGAASTIHALARIRMIHAHSPDVIIARFEVLGF